MPVRLLRPMYGLPVNSVYFGTDENVLRATGNADDRMDLALNYTFDTRTVTEAAINVSSTAKTYRMMSASAQTITLNQTGWAPVNTVITIEQVGAGGFTIIAGVGVTINGTLTSKGVNTITQLVKDGPNTWTAI